MLAKPAFELVNSSDMVGWDSGGVTEQTLMTHSSTGWHDDPTVEPDTLSVHLPLWISKLLHTTRSTWKQKQMKSRTNQAWFSNLILIDSNIV
jgi:hypothetical protein